MHHPVALPSSPLSSSSSSSPAPRRIPPRSESPCLPGHGRSGELGRLPSFVLDAPGDRDARRLALEFRYLDAKLDFRTARVAHAVLRKELRFLARQPAPGLRAERERVAGALRAADARLERARAEYRRQRRARLLRRLGLT